MDALEALAQFKSTGDTKRVSRFKDVPTLKFDPKGGQFVILKYTNLRDMKEGSKAGKSVISGELISSNAAFTIRDGETYKTVDVKVGDKIDIFAPTALDTFIRQTVVGQEVYIRCDGKVKETRNGKAVNFYKFDVVAK